MEYLLRIYLFGYIVINCESHVSDIGSIGNDIEVKSMSEDEHLNAGAKKSIPPCWTNFEAQNHFNDMNELDDRYARAKGNFAINNQIDKEMLALLLSQRGAAEREIHRAGGDPGKIPAGINLGGHSMMRLPNSILFLHRMKLRNNTYFRVNYFQSDLSNMVLTARISLNDLHLMGSYDRCVTDRDPSTLFYRPTYGQVEFLLKNVKYKMEGRYRLLQNKLTIELIISEMQADDIKMVYLYNATSSQPIKLQRKNIEEFLARLRTDLDRWLKDYFNDYLMYLPLEGDREFQKYDQEKTVKLNEYADLITESIHNLVALHGFESVKLPSFTIFALDGMVLKLTDGVLRGLESMHRRSAATGKQVHIIRKVDAVVGFSNLKATYIYEANIPAAKGRTLTGSIVLSADELTAHMAVSLVNDSWTSDLQFDSISQSKPESLVVEGPANRMIANFKYVLEQHVIAIISNTIVHNVKLLSSIVRCVPLLTRYVEHGDDVNMKQPLDRYTTEHSSGDNIPNNSSIEEFKYGSDKNIKNDEEILKNVSQDEDINSNDNNDKHGDDVNMKQTLGRYTTDYSSGDNIPNNSSIEGFKYSSDRNIKNDEEISKNPSQDEDINSNDNNNEMDDGKAIISSEIENIDGDDKKKLNADDSVDRSNSNRDGNSGSAEPNGQDFESKSKEAEKTIEK